MRDTIRKSSNRYARKITPEAAASAIRMAAGRLQAMDALKHNRCPCCGREVRRNLSLTGWVQCSQFGAESFRADPKQPACNWQGFTE